MQVNTCYPASTPKGTRALRHPAGSAESHIFGRKSPVLTPRELRRIVAEVIG